MGERVADALSKGKMDEVNHEMPGAIDVTNRASKVSTPNNKIDIGTTSGTGARKPHTTRTSRNQDTKRENQARVTRTGTKETGKRQRKAELITKNKTPRRTPKDD